MHEILEESYRYKIKFLGACVRTAKKENDINKYSDKKSIHLYLQSHGVNYQMTFKVDILHGENINGNLTLRKVGKYSIPKNKTEKKNELSYNTEYYIPDEKNIRLKYLTIKEKKDNEYVHSLSNRVLACHNFHLILDDISGFVKEDAINLYYDTFKSTNYNDFLNHIEKAL